MYALMLINAMLYPMKIWRLATVKSNIFNLGSLSRQYKFFTFFKEYTKRFL